MSTATSTDLVIPKLNDLWPGQGGRFAGLHPLGGYLIAAADFLEKHLPFGLHNKRLDGFSDVDGAENTRKLIELGSPAAKAAAGYTEDGHADFYLPSQRELMQIYAAQGPQQDGPIVISSTPYDAGRAWVLDFANGCCGIWLRINERSVLPVRRFNPFIS